MEPKIYLLVFDVVKNEQALTALHQYIVDSKDFVGYWNYIPFIYAVKSYLPANELATKFRSILKTSFLISQIHPDNISGLLPKAGWEWFSHSHGQLSLSDLLQQQFANNPLAPPGPGNLLGGGLLGFGNPPKKDK